MGNFTFKKSCNKLKMANDGTNREKTHLLLFP